MKRNIFLVVGSEYESSCVFAAFEAERDADALVVACQKYEAGPRPQSPDDTEDTPANNAAWELFIKRDKRWRKRHPAGDGGDSFDTWGVQRIRLQEPSRAPALTSAVGASAGVPGDE